MLGPTAEDLTDRTATGTSGAGWLPAGARARADARLLRRRSRRTYAGLRRPPTTATTSSSADAGRRYVLVGGIRSTGLTVRMAIAGMCRDLLAQAAGLALSAARGSAGTAADAQHRRGLPRPYQDAALIAADPAYGNVVCFCERVTAGEIRDAYRSPSRRPAWRGSAAAPGP